VVGDNSATNSIGKSAFLMVIDFLLGGDTFLDHNSDVMDELGHHKYFAKFLVADRVHAFCRETGTPDVVFKCTGDYQIVESMTIREYRTFLNSAYGTDALGVTFRAIASPFCRIWGKDNLNPKRPLDTHKNTKAVDALNLALRIYRKYETVEPLERALAEESSKKTALQKAQTQKLIPKISAKQFKANAQSAEAMDNEISEIKAELLKYAINIRELVSREVTEIKQSKDCLLDAKFRLESRLRRGLHPGI